MANTSTVSKLGKILGAVTFATAMVLTPIQATAQSLPIKPPSGPAETTRLKVPIGQSKYSLFGAAPTKYARSGYAFCIEAGLPEIRGDELSKIPMNWPLTPSGPWDEFKVPDARTLTYLSEKYDLSQPDNGIVMSAIAHFTYETDYIYKSTSGALSLPQQTRLQNMYNAFSKDPKYAPMARRWVQEAKTQAPVTLTTPVVTTVTPNKQLSVSSRVLNVTNQLLPNIPVTLTINAQDPEVVFETNGQKTIQTTSGKEELVRITNTTPNAQISASAKVYNNSHVFLLRSRTRGNSQSMITFENDSRPAVTPWENVNLIAYTTIGIEKAIGFQPDNNADQMVPDSDANAVTNLADTVFELQLANGTSVTWDSDYVAEDTTASYDYDGKSQAQYHVNGQKTTTKPSSGPIQAWANEDGKVYFRHIKDGEQYQIVEIKAPKHVHPQLQRTGRIDTAKLMPTLNDESGTNVHEFFLDEDIRRHTTAADRGFINELQKFRFKARKWYVESGPTNSNVLDTAFSEEGQRELAKQKHPYPHVLVELRDDQGQPITWDNPVMHFIKKQPSKYALKGTWATLTGPVQLRPDAEGYIEAYGFLRMSKDNYRLVEVSTSPRSKIDDQFLTIDATGEDVTRNEFVHSSVRPGAKLGIQNNIDFTGIRLEKKGQYLSTPYGPKQPTPEPNLGQASFEGAVYGLFYGDGPKAQQPVLTSDWVLDIAKTRDLTATFGTLPDGQVRWQGEANKPLTVYIDNLPWGSYYVQELKAGVGHHIDPKRYYFGDRPQHISSDDEYVTMASVPSSAQYSDYTFGNGTSTDHVKLMKSELEKQVRTFVTTSPFMTSTLPEYGNGTKPIYEFKDVSVSLVNNHTKGTKNVGATTRGGATYGLFYAQNTIDGQGVRNKPVKWSDRVVEHMNVTKGEKVTTDYKTSFGTAVTGSTDVVIKTSSKNDDTFGMIGVENVAYGAYYWKEIDTTPGLIIDPKEYGWGIHRVADDGLGEHGNYIGKPNRYNITSDITQTTTQSVKESVTENWAWSNDFASNRKSGSTNTVLTFGFSSRKISGEQAPKVQGDGENGVKFTLTPIEGTVGEPRTTTSFRQVVKDNAGKLTHVDGYFEFRTIPFGRYVLTSDSSTRDNKQNNVEVYEAKPVIVDMSRTDSGDYSLRFYIDDNEDNILQPEGSNNDKLLSEWISSRDKQIPTQARLHVLANGAQDDVNDQLVDQFGEPYYGEDRVWDRPGHKDVDPNGINNNNFISAEVNVDGAGFELVNVRKEKPDLLIKTTATNKGDNGKTLPANTSNAIINDHVTFSAKEGHTLALKSNETYTLKTVLVESSSEKPVGRPVCTTFTYDGRTNEMDVSLPANVQGLHNKKVTVFEYLYAGKVDNCDTIDSKVNPQLAKHDDPSDANQTLLVKHDGVINTKAVNAQNDKKTVESTVNQSIKDTIDLTKANLIPGQVYTVKSTVPVISCTADHNNLPEVAFDSLPSPIAQLTKTKDRNGKCAVALPYRSVTVVKSSKVAPNVPDPQDSSKTKDTLLKDTQFVYQDGMTSIDVIVSGIDLTNASAKQKIVMFESIESKDITPLVHADIDDLDQTVTTQPSIGTELFVQTADQKAESKVYTPNTQVTLVDKVKVRGITSNKSYEATLRLMTPTSDSSLDSKDGKEDGVTPYLDRDGKPVTQSTILNVTKHNVDYNVAVTFIANNQPQRIIAYETVTDVTSKDVITSHEDPKDEKQIVTPMDAPVTPQRGMTTELIVLRGQNTTKQYDHKAKSIDVQDNVTVTGVSPGTYQSIVTLMTPTLDEALDAKDGISDKMTPYLDNKGKQVISTSTVDIKTSESQTYQTPVSFTPNGKKVPITAYQTLVNPETKQVISQHTVANDDKQTIVPIDVTVPPSESPSEQPSDQPSESQRDNTEDLAKTGVSIYGIITAIVILTAILGGLLVLKRQKSLS